MVGVLKVETGIANRKTAYFKSHITLLSLKLQLLQYYLSEILFYAVACSSLQLLFVIFNMTPRKSVRGRVSK